MNGPWTIGRVVWLVHVCTVPVCRKRKCKGKCKGKRARLTLAELRDDDGLVAVDQGVECALFTELEHQQER